MTQPDGNQQFFDTDGLPLGMPPTPQYPGQPHQTQQFQNPRFQQPQYPAPDMQGFPPYQHQGPVEQKSWLVTMLLCLFLGGLGIHNFYTGQTGRGVAKIAMQVVGWLFFVTLIGAFISGVIFFSLGVWTLVELIMILSGTGGYDRGVPLRK